MNNEKLNEVKRIAGEFKDFIAGRSFGFAGNPNSVNENIIRYKEGLEEITGLTGCDADELERKCEITNDDGLVDVKFKYENIAFEYTFACDDFINEIDKDNGWWKIHYVSNDGSFEDIDKLFDVEEETAAEEIQDDYMER